jgi:phosphoserine phosphatase
MAGEGDQVVDYGSNRGLGYSPFVVFGDGRNDLSLLN